MDLHNNQIYKHKKTNQLYLLLFQDVALEKDLTPMVVYLSISNCKIWTRPKTEFIERFEIVNKNFEVIV
jgi:hypothetical protein